MQNIVVKRKFFTFKFLGEIKREFFFKPYSRIYEVLIYAKTI